MDRHILAAARALRARQPQLVLFGVLIQAVLGSSAKAQLISNWVGDSNNFTNAASWDNGVPSANDTAIFRRGTFAYTVDFSGAITTNKLRVGSNTVTFSSANGTASYSVANTDSTAGIIIGELAGDQAVVNSSLSTLYAPKIDLGEVAGSTGTLNMTGGSVSVADDGRFLIGVNGTGVVNVSNGAVVQGSSTLGRFAGSIGSITIDGPGTTWKEGPKAGITVGSGGQGFVTITNGATFLGGLYIGANGSGTVVVDGTGSKLLGELIVGPAGKGKVVVSNGGQIIGESGEIGAQPGFAPGSVTIDGANSAWTMDSSLDLYGGDLTISNGAQVKNQISTTINAFRGSSIVSIDGPDSQWTTGNLSVLRGSSNPDILMKISITKGGHFSSVFTTIGNTGNLLSGGVLVDGASSTWSILQLQIIGAYLDILHGANVADDFATADIGSKISIDGVGSTWKTAGNLSVNSSNGVFATNGGKVEVGKYLYVPGANGSSGTVTVDGANSKIAISGELSTGLYSGSSTLIIKNGGQVTDASAHLVNYSAQYPSSLTVAGTNSSWVTLGDVTLGELLTISDGAQVSIGGTLTVLPGGKIQGNQGITAAIKNAGVVAPGMSPGKFTVTGNYNQDPTGSLQIELGGHTAGTEFDQLIVSGNAALDGALQVSLINSFTPAIGDSFDILDFTSETGTFAALQLPNLGASFGWDISRLYSDGLIAVVPEPPAGVLLAFAVPAFVAMRGLRRLS